MKATRVSLLRLVAGFACSLALALVAPAALAQSVTFARTATGYFYPLGSSVFLTGCPRNGGGWMGRDSDHGGCYFHGLYHIGFDMFSSTTTVGSAAYAVTTGTVIYVDPASSWSAPVSDWRRTDNTAVFVVAHTESGRPFVYVAGHLLRSSVKVRVGDVIGGGTQMGVVGYWPGQPHVHEGVWPDLATLPPSPWGAKSNASWPSTGGTVDPLAWTTASSAAPVCQNGGTVEYRPNGLTPTHPWGTLFVVKDGPQPNQVYVLDIGNRARPIPSRTMLNQLYGLGRGFDFRDVIQISLAEFKTYSMGPVVSGPLSGNGRSQPDGRLIQQWGGSEVSIVTEVGYRRPFASPEAFANLGYQLCNIAGVNDYYRYPVGRPISE